jgi:hypothetical protein
VKAWILRDRSVEGAVARDVQIYNCIDSLPPPVCLEDFPGEYVCRQEKSLTRVLPVPGCYIAISIPEPRPVEVRQDKGDAVAGFSMRVVLRNSRGKACVPPSPFDMHITWALKTHTFVSVTKQRVAPTSRAALLSPFLKEITGTSNPRKRKLRLPSWRVDVTEPRNWAQETTLWLPVIENACPPPTFLTPYLTRRYSVSMHLDISSADQGRASFDLTVPIQIVYHERATETRCDQRTHTLPRYVV